MTQTTAERITELIADNVYCYGGDIDGVVTTGRRIAAEIDALIEQRDEARAEVESLRVVNRQVRADYASQIGPLKAEVERLRPAAEAWEAYEDYQSTTSQSNMIRTITEKWPSMADVAQKARVFMAAAARARAAKEGRG